MPSPTISLLDRLSPYFDPNYWATPNQIMCAVRLAILNRDDPRPCKYHPRWPIYSNACQFTLHDAVYFLCANGVRPHNTHQLALEWPHQAQGDKSKVAYTRQEADATRVQLPTDHPRYSDEQKYTTTSLTKYLRRHWPYLPDHIIRDLDARFNPTVKCHMETDYRRMICIMNAGPRSCMTTAYGSIPFDGNDDEMAQAWFKSASPDDCDEPDWDRHPYTVYRNEHGWSMAYRTENDGTQIKIAARALVYSGPATRTPCYVRSYGDGGRDTLLEQWLEGQGIRRRSSWPDEAKLEAVEAPRGHDGYMMPYIDGDHQRVRFDGDAFYIDSDGGSATDTCGTIDPDEVDWTCDDCERGFRDDDDSGTTVGRHDESRVCESCLENYTLVRGSVRWSNYREYYISDRHDSVLASLDSDGDETGDHVDGDHMPYDYVQTEDRCGTTCAIRIDDACVIDGDHWPTNETGIVELNEEAPNGDRYAWEADAWQDGDGQWHHHDHEHITYDGEKWLKDDAWQCEATGWWYPEHVDQAVDPVTGDTVHPDYIEGCNRDADFIIVYGDDTCNAMPHIDVPAQSMLVFDACTSEVFALVD